MSKSPNIVEPKQSLPIGALFIQLHEVKDLPTKDKEKCAPFVKILSDGIQNVDHCYTSTYKYHTSHPKWIGEFYYIQVKSVPLKFTVQCWDTDNNEEHFFGEAEIVHQEEKELFEDNVWFDLEDKKKLLKGSRLRNGTLPKVKLSYHIQFGTDLSKGAEFAINRKKDKKQSVKKLIMRKKSKECRKLKELKEKTLYEMISKESVDTVRQWLQMYGNTANINALDQDGNAALHIACMDCTLYPKELFFVLLSQKDIDVNIRNASKNTPLHYLAVYWQDVDLSVFDRLLARGADVNALNDGLESPLMKAITNTCMRKPILKKLLNKGANPNTLNSHGEGILHYAARLGRTYLVSLILRYCENISIKGAEGLTPMQIAASYADGTENESSMNQFRMIELTLAKAEDLIEFLQSMNLMEYRAYLIKNEYYLDTLCKMSNDQLQKLDIKVGPRQRLIKALKEQRETQKNEDELEKEVENSGELAEQDKKYIEDVKRILSQHCKQTESIMFIEPQQLEYLDELGRGASGVVWKGFMRIDSGASVEVAIKVLFGVAEDELEPFKKELKVLSSVSHPNVVKFLGVALKPKLSMVMEYCSRGSLYHLLNEETTRIGFDLFFSLVKQIVEGLRALHSHHPQILHRDLKTLNILLTHNYTPKLADFGMSLETTEGSDILRSLEGTAAYLPPEILGGSKYSTSSDIYSFGVLLWETLQRMLTGKYLKPFEEYPDIKGPAASAMIIYQASNGLRPTIPESCPLSLSTLVTNCWRPEPDKRPNIEKVKETILSIEESYLASVTEWNSLLKFSTEPRKLMKKSRIRQINL